MYATFFGLKQAPFSIAPDPRYLFMSERHREALAHLIYGIGAGGGFVLLSGEIGAGKTTVCRCFLEQMPAHCRVAYIFNPKLTVTELLQTVCDEFGVAVQTPGGTAPSVKDHTDALNAFLLAAHAAGDSCVLVIDEAQNLSADVLEQLRLLTNLETSERKLLQIILIGQPELRGLLARPELEQLAQRVVARFHLDALSAGDTAQYVQHRMAVAGWQGPLPFDDAALTRIHVLSRGVPRRINLLCDRALLGAYGQGRKTIDRHIVERAAAEVFDGPAASAGPVKRPSVLLWSGLGLAAGVAATLAMVGPGRALLSGPGRVPAALASAPPPSLPRAAPVSMAASGLPAASAAVAGSGAGSVPPPSASAAASIPSAWPTVTEVAHAPSAGPSAAVPAATPSAASGDAGATVTPAPLETLLTSAEVWRDATAALSSLAARWTGVTTGAAENCASLAQRQLPCHHARGSFAVLRRLDRPALLTVFDTAERPGQVLLTGLSDENADVMTATGQLRRMPLTLLSRQWRGEFTTLWRSPAGYASLLVEGSRGPVVEALAEQLDRWGPSPMATSAAAAGSPRAERGLFTAALKARLIAFQVSQGLSPDGVAGPTVFMQINRLAHIDEPRLQTRN